MAYMTTMIDEPFSYVTNTCSAPLVQHPRRISRPDCQDGKILWRPHLLETVHTAQQTGEGILQHLRRIDCSLSYRID